MLARNAASIGRVAAINTIVPRSQRISQLITTARGTMVTKNGERGAGARPSTPGQKIYRYRTRTRLPMEINSRSGGLRNHSSSPGTDVRE